MSVAGGIGWRRYLNISDALVSNYYSATNAQEESPGFAYSLSSNYGYAKGAWSFSLGIAYSHIEYRNNKTANILGMMPFETIYIHQIISIPFTTTYSVGEKKVWHFGASLDAGWLVHYYQIDNSFFKREHDFGKCAVASLSLLIGNKIFENKNLEIYIDCKLDYTSPVNYKTETVIPYDEPFGGAPHYKDGYEFKPHSLIVPSMQFRLQRKLH